MRRILILIVFGTVGTALLVGLGVWQVRRLAWKQEILAEIESRIAAPPAAFLPADPDPERDRYLPVRLSGTIEAGEIHVLVSTKDAGAGYRIIAPFLADAATDDGDAASGGRRIMIDRGFVRSENRDQVRQLGPATVTGNLHWPQETDSFTPEAEIDANIWYARDVPAMASALDTEPVLLVARSATDPGIRPLPVDAHGIPNDHLQYAVTWFSLAAIWAGMSILLLWRSRARKTG